jgi:ATP-binding cassette subfamily C protein LapB
LDEPTASLDGELENHVLRELINNQKMKNQTLIVVSHKPSIIKYASRLIVLEAGKILQDGPRDEVITKLRGQQPMRVANV